MDRRAVHELDGDRDDARGDDGVDAGAGGLARLEAEQDRPGALGRAQDAQGRLGDQAKHAFRAGDQAEQVEPARVQMLAAEADDLARRQHHFHAHQVVGGDAVLQAVGAAGIHADVAGDGAGELRGGIGRIEEAVARDRIGDAEIGDARLQRDRAVVVVDVQDLRHLRDADDDGVLQRQRPAGERGAGASRHHLDAALVAIGQDLAGFLGRLGQDDGQGRFLVGGQRVGLVGLDLVRMVDDAVGRRDQAAQRGDDLRPGGQDLGIGVRQADHGALRRWGKAVV